MKNLLLFFWLIIAAGCSHAQNKNTAKVPVKIPVTIPPYRILTTDSVNKTPADLKKNVPVMIVYFAPDCGHCQHLMYEMKPKMKYFKKIQIIMITFAEPLKASQIFYRDFDLIKYPNFTVGTEGYTYLVQKFYDVRSTPYIALYDKSHKFVKGFEKAPTVDELAAEVRKL